MMNTMNNRKVSTSPLFQTNKSGFMPVTISAKWMRHRFMCSEDYIVNECHGRCCEGAKGQTLISILPKEEEIQVGLGEKVLNNKLVPNPETGKCPHKAECGLCNLHKVNLKPFGCVASPFTLNSGGTLILRYRYSRLKCHRHPNEEDGLPAYVVFRAGLDLIFGVDDAERICKMLELGCGDISVLMPVESYNNIYFLDSIKKK